MSFANPNFTIITPGGCNSFCSFCTEPFKQKASPDYLANLVEVLSGRLPVHFTQCSISGGEPTLSPSLAAILALVVQSGQFTKVVLTTNGARLPQFVPQLKQSINHLNVSRHAIGYEANTAVFGTRHIITDEALLDCSRELATAGIDVNLNHVYTRDSGLTVQYVHDYVAYARSVGASSVSFRYDQAENSLAPTYLEKLFDHLPVVNEGRCPVCRNHTVLVDGFPVVFKASFAEPSKAIDDVYELIYGIHGRLTTDWEGEHTFSPEMAQQYVQAYKANPEQHHAVVPHTMAAPNVPTKGQRPAPKRVITVHPEPAAVIPRRRVAPSAAVAAGGGCGKSGGGCGT